MVRQSMGVRREESPQARRGTMTGSGAHHHPSAWATRRQLLRGSVVTGLGLSGAWLIACGGDKKSSSSTSGAEERFQQAGVANTATVGSAAKVDRSVGKRGGRMVGSIGEPDSFDPHRDAGFPGVQVVNGVYSTL